MEATEGDFYKCSRREFGGSAGFFRFFGMGIGEDAGVLAEKFDGNHLVVHDIIIL